MANFVLIVLFDAVVAPNWRPKSDFTICDNCAREQNPEVEQSSEVEEKAERGARGSEGTFEGAETKMSCSGCTVKVRPMLLSWPTGGGNVWRVMIYSEGWWTKHVYPLAEGLENGLVIVSADMAFIPDVLVFRDDLFAGGGGMTSLSSNSKKVTGYRRSYWQPNGIASRKRVQEHCAGVFSHRMRSNSPTNQSFVLSTSTFLGLSNIETYIIELPFVLVGIVYFYFLFYFYFYVCLLYY